MTTRHTTYYRAKHKQPQTYRWVTVLSLANFAGTLIIALVVGGYIPATSAGLTVLVVPMMVTWATVMLLLRYASIAERRIRNRRH